MNRACKENHLFSLCIDCSWLFFLKTFFHGGYFSQQAKRLRHFIDNWDFYQDPRNRYNCRHGLNYNRWVLYWKFQFFEELEDCWTGQLFGCFWRSSLCQNLPQGNGHCPSLWWCADHWNYSSQPLLPILLGSHHLSKKGIRMQASSPMEIDSHTAPTNSQFLNPAQKIKPIWIFIITYTWKMKK